MNAAADPTRIDAPDHEELVLLYEVSVADIAFFKQQQWSVTNYAVAVHVALIVTAFELLPQPLHIAAVWTLIVLAWGTVTAGFWLVGRLQESILGRRTRLQRIRDRFGEPFRQAWTISKPHDDVYQLLYSVVLVSASLLTWLILSKA